MFANIKTKLAPAIVLLALVPIIAIACDESSSTNTTEPPAPTREMSTPMPTPEPTSTLMPDSSLGDFSASDVSFRGLNAFYESEIASGAGAITLNDYARFLLAEMVRPVIVAEFEMLRDMIADLSEEEFRSDNDDADLLDAIPVDILIRGQRIETYELNIISKNQALAIVDAIKRDTVAWVDSIVQSTRGEIFHENYGIFSFEFRGIERLLNSILADEGINIRLLNREQIIFVADTLTDPLWELGSTISNFTEVEWAILQSASGPLAQLFQGLGADEVIVFAEGRNLGPDSLILQKLNRHSALRYVDALIIAVNDFFDQYL